MKTFNGESRSVTASKYGRELMLYSVFMMIELRLSQELVNRSLKELFRLSLPPGTVGKLKSKAAKVYESIYEAIVEMVCRSATVYVDETKVSVKGSTAYVWVFACEEAVAYVFSESREKRVLEQVLTNFHGVLVSDFYAAYDSIPCSHQKCLIHLMRDLNTVVCRNPFDNELKTIAEQFGDVMKAIVDTIDRYGLKTRFLKKHRLMVKKFLDVVEQLEFANEETQLLINRIVKYRNSLFTFLNHDGVAWHNNTAEHAVKAFVYLRNAIGGTSSTRGIKEYLILLSICETCRLNGMSFLEYLRSGEPEIESYASRESRKRTSYPKSDDFAEKSRILTNG